MNPYLKRYILKYLNDPIKGASIDLSQETLSNSDYDFIARIIKQSPYLQTITLPTNYLKNIEFELKTLNLATKKNSILTNIYFKPAIDIHQLSEKSMYLYRQIESRLKRNSKKIFGIHGGGNIGLGLMADIVSKSEFEYQIMATTSQPFLRTLINANNEVQLQHGCNQNKITKVKNVQMISRNDSDIIDLYQNSTLVAICLTPGVFTESAKDIARGLINRFRSDGSGLKILVLMNMPNCAAFVRDQLIIEITSLAKDSAEAKRIIATLEIIPTVADRIVTRIPDDQVKEQIKEKLLFHVSKEFMNSRHLKQQIDKIIADPTRLVEAINKLNLQFNLFNAESQFAHYVPTDIPELHRFSAMKQIKKFEQIEMIKNKLINGPHAILAWLGSLNGCKSVGEAIRLPGMLKLLNYIILQEIAPVLKAEYPDLTDDELMSYKTLFIERCMESKDDPVVRVARDPLRKIESGGRIRGTLELHQKHSLDASTMGLELGIAAAILYSINGCDRSNQECQKISEIYNQRKSFRDVLCYQGSTTSGQYRGLDAERDIQLINKILNKITFLQSNCKHPQTNIYSNLMRTHNQSIAKCYNPRLFNTSNTEHAGILGSKEPKNHLGNTSYLHCA